MKTITIDYELYLKEKMEISGDSFREGYQSGVKTILNGILVDISGSDTSIWVNSTESRSLTKAIIKVLRNNSKLLREELDIELKKN